MTKLLIIGIILLIVWIMKLVFDMIRYDDPKPKFEAIINWSLFIIGLIFIYLS